MQRHRGIKALHVVALMGTDHMARAGWWREAGSEAGKGGEGAVPLMQVDQGERGLSHAGTLPSAALHQLSHRMNSVNTTRNRAKRPMKKHSRHPKASSKS